MSGKFLVVLFVAFLVGVQVQVGRGLPLRTAQPSYPNESSAYLELRYILALALAAAGGLLLGCVYCRDCEPLAARTAAVVRNPPDSGSCEASNNNGPVPLRDIANNNANAYISADNEERNTASTSRESVVELEPLPYALPRDIAVTDPLDLQQHPQTNCPTMAILNENAPPIKPISDVTSALTYLHSRGHLYGYHVMQQRQTNAHVDARTLNDEQAESDFEARWMTLKPNNIPKVDEHIAIVHAPSTSRLSIDDAGVSRSTSMLYGQLSNFRGSLEDVRNIYLTHNEHPTIECHQGITNFQNILESGVNEEELPEDEERDRHIIPFEQVLTLESNESSSLFVNELEKPKVNSPNNSKPFESELEKTNVIAEQKSVSEMESNDIKQTSATNSYKYEPGFEDITCSLSETPEPVQSSDNITQVTSQKLETTASEVTLSATEVSDNLQSLTEPDTHPIDDKIHEKMKEEEILKQLKEERHNVNASEFVQGNDSTVYKDLNNSTKGIDNSVNSAWLSDESTKYLDLLSWLNDDSTKYFDLPNFEHSTEEFLHNEKNGSHEQFASGNEKFRLNDNKVGSDNDVVASSVEKRINFCASTPKEKSKHYLSETVPNQEQKIIRESSSPFESPTKSLKTDTYDENSSGFGPFETSMEYKCLKTDIPKEECLAFSSNFNEMNLATPSPLRNVNFLNEVLDVSEFPLDDFNSDKTELNEPKGENSDINEPKSENSESENYKSENSEDIFSPGSITEKDTSSVVTTNNKSETNDTTKDTQIVDVSYGTLPSYSSCATENVAIQNDPWMLPQPEMMRRSPLNDKDVTPPQNICYETQEIEDSPNTFQPSANMMVSVQISCVNDQNKSENTDQGETNA